MTQSFTDQLQSGKESDSFQHHVVVEEMSSSPFLHDKEEVSTTIESFHNQHENGTTNNLTTTTTTTTQTPPRIPRWTELMKKRLATKEKNLFHLGETELWHISVQPNRHSSHSLRMVIHDKQTQHKLAFVLLTTTTTTTTSSSSSSRNRSSLMGLYIDPKHRAQGWTRRILSLWLQWCMYADPEMHPQTQVIRKPLLCCVLEHALGFVVSSSSYLPVFLVPPELPTTDNQRIQLHSIPPQCLRGVFSARDIQREGLQVHCSTCLRRNEQEEPPKEGKEQEQQQQQQQQQQQENEGVEVNNRQQPEKDKLTQPHQQIIIRRRIHLNARFERLEPWKTLPDDPILQTALRPEQLRLILLGKL